MLSQCPKIAYGFRSASPSDEIEALQTDVMRFMAILGLCLMAIFALVQSLPIIAPDTMSLLESKNNLVGDIAILQDKSQKLKAEIIKIQGQVKLQNQAVATVKLAAQRQRAELTEQRRELEQIQEARNLAVSEHKNLAVQNQKLKEIQRQLKHNQTDLHRLRGKIEQARQELSTAQTRIEKTVQAQLPKPGRNVPPDSSTPQQKGFTLRFASEAALDQLVGNQTVSFYAFVGQHAWRLQWVAGALRFRKAQKPPAYYQMSQITVPLPYRQKLTTQLAVHRGHQVTWGVSLPESITTQIQQRVKGSTRGDLVISADGRLEAH